MNENHEIKGTNILIVVYLFLILSIFGISLYSFINQNLLFDFLRPAYFKSEDEVAGTISIYTFFAGFLMLQTTKMLVRSDEYKLSPSKALLFILGLATVSISGVVFGVTYPWQANYLYEFAIILLLFTQTFQQVLDIVANITDINVVRYIHKYSGRIFTVLFFTELFMLLMADYPLR